VEEYEIVLSGWIGDLCRDWIPYAEIDHLPDGTTRLRGKLQDQTALHGVIGRARDMGIQLVRVERREAMAASTNPTKGSSKPANTTKPTDKKSGDKKPSSSGKKSR
jgi:hypothetical protein